MAEAIGIIKDEHRRYRSVLYCLEQVVADLARNGGEPDFEMFRAVIRYVQEFLNKFHHPKEDGYLFPALLRRYPAAKSRIDRLSQDHRACDALIGDLAHAMAVYAQFGDKGFNQFRDAVGKFVAGERAHALTEEREVLPLAEKYLTARDWAEINAAFLAHDDPVFGAEPREEFRRLFSRIVALAPAPHGLGPARS